MKTQIQKTKWTRYKEFTQDFELLFCINFFLFFSFFSFSFISVCALVWVYVWEERAVLYMQTMLNAIEMKFFFYFYFLLIKINLAGKNPVPQHYTMCRIKHPHLQIVVEDHLCGNLLLQENRKRNLQVLNNNSNYAYEIFLHPLILSWWVLQ